MTIEPAPTYRLVKRGEAGLTCDAEGVVLGGVRLAWADEDGAVKWQIRSRDEVADVLETAYGPQPSVVIDRCHRGLRRMAQQLETGDLALAGMEALMLRLPPIAPDRMAKLAATEIIRGGDAWQAEPRVPAGQTGGGQWTTGGGKSPASPPERRSESANHGPESTDNGPSEITVSSGNRESRRQSGNGFYINSFGGGVLYIPTLVSGQQVEPTEVHALDANAFQVGWGDGKIELKDTNGRVYQTGTTPTELQSFNATTGRALGVAIYAHPDVPLGSPDSPPTEDEQRQHDREQAAQDAGTQASLDSPSGQATTFLGETIVSLPFLALTPLEAGAAPNLWLNSVEASWPTTEGVGVSGGRAIDSATQYEAGVRAIYPKIAQQARNYDSVVDGEWLTGRADTVAKIFGKDTGIEAKYIRSWSNSIYNPESTVGSKTFAADEQNDILLQARKYSNGYEGGAVYHTNSVEFSSHYYAVFLENGIYNVRFVITPTF